jgi:hypothetical protein
MTAKKQQTTALQAAQQCGVNRGVQLQAFVKGVAYARKHGDWRSVKDELPSDDVDVLVCTVDHDCYINYFVDEDWINGDDTITHWMPLPSLPEPSKTE